MIVFRIVHKMYSDSLFASGMRGRWNSAGNRVIYAADSVPLAFLENMVRRQGVGFNQDFRIMLINIAEPFSMQQVDISALNEGWRDANDYAQCQLLGDAWYNAESALVLKVPSAVVPESSNYVINTRHAEYSQVSLAGVTNLAPDPRIEDILKKYRAS